jgi:hypothetical protein
MSVTLQIPANYEFPSMDRAFEILKNEKKAIDAMIDLRVRDAAAFPVVIHDRPFILAKTRTCHVIQRADDWREHRKSGFCVSFDNDTCICDQEAETIEAVQKFAHGIFFLAHPPTLDSAS